MTLAILDRKGTRAFAPRISQRTRPFWEALGTGRFLLSRCLCCGRLAFPPRSFCADCGGQTHDWQEASGNGKLYSLTIVHAGPPQLMTEGPYAGAIIDLVEGVRLVAEWIGDRKVALDSPAELIVVRYEDGCLFGARPLLA